MIVAALIVLLIAVLAVLTGIFGGSSPATFDLGSFTVKTNATAVFFLGMATLLLVVLGLAMLRAGVRRANARRRDRKKISELSTKLDTYQQRDTGPAGQRDGDRGGEAPPDRMANPPVGRPPGAPPPPPPPPTDRPASR
ncbi:MAG: hypothetical protein M3130_00545 [Actinomycetota bacterium]|nr:hypothetical protein [Actinomycetota bacterium]